MAIITLVYGSFVYLVFFRFKLLPWNRTTRNLTLMVGAVGLTAFLVAYSNLTPGSSQAVLLGRVVDIAPQVGGVVTAVPVRQNERVEEGAVLFEIDPTLFAARVKDLEANLGLQRLRLEQFSTLAQVDAASVFEVEQTEAQIEQLEARLKGARFDLDNCTVRAPFAGRVPKLLLKPGVQVSPARSVLTFVDAEQLYIFAIFDQKGLPNVEIGDRATVNFPALPGRVFETRVTEFVSGIKEGQILATGQLDSVLRQRMARTYPVLLALPDDFPPELQKLGLAANVMILTEASGPIAYYAMVIQWISTSLDAVL
ncbi:MAG: efflux RND transporter periplasmic adaptor subunit [Myxococcota bacterium]|nr:efflux RND transporter periplasmic adaptor subunit [Myxococcota bacterium]